MLTRELEETLDFAVKEAVRLKHEYVTLEHLLHALLDDKTARDILFNCGAKLEEIGADLEEFFDLSMEKLPDDVVQVPEPTSTFQLVLNYAVMQAQGSGQRRIDGGNILAALFEVENSHAVYVLQKQGISRLDILNYLSHGISKIDDFGDEMLEGAGFEGGFAEERAAQGQKKPKPLDSLYCRTC